MLSLRRSRPGSGLSRRPVSRVRPGTTEAVSSAGNEALSIVASTLDAGRSYGIGKEVETCGLSRGLHPVSGASAWTGPAHYVAPSTVRSGPPPGRPDQPSASSRGRAFVCKHVAVGRAQMLAAPSGGMASGWTTVPATAWPQIAKDPTNLNGVAFSKLLRTDFLAKLTRPR